MKKKASRFAASEDRSSAGSGSSERASSCRVSGVPIAPAARGGTGREQELPGFHEERHDRLGEGDESVAQPRRRELQAAGELDPPQQHGAERRSPVPEPGGEKADHAERADPGEDPYVHRQPYAEVEAHKGQRGPGADRTGEERAEQQERTEGLEHDRAECQRLEQAGEVKE